MSVNSDMKHEEVGKAVVHLVSLNLLRYQRDMTVACHSKVVKEFIRTLDPPD